MTDFYDPITHNRRYLNDGLNQVLQVTTEEMEAIMDSNFNANSDLYKKIISESDRKITYAFPTIFNVLNDAQFIGWNDPSTPLNCFDKAKKQSNAFCVGSVYRIDTYSETCNDASEGASKVSTDLYGGKSVVAGVRTSENGIGKNTNKYTCHFIVIVGQGFDVVDGKIVNYFSYYDNATSDHSRGTNLLENRLYEIKDANGATRYEDRTNTIVAVSRNGVRIKGVYKLTEVR